MSAILLPGKWRSQPSGPTPADRARFPTLKHLWGGVKVFGGGSGQPGWWNAAGQANAVFGSGSGGYPGGNTWVTAPFGHVTNFDNTGTGTESSVVIALGDSSGSGAPSGTNFTVFVTVNLSSVTGTQCLYGAGNSGIEVRSNGTGLELLKSGVASMHTSSMGLSAGAWHRLAISYDGATVSAYRDGRLISSGSSSQTFAHSQQYRSGGRTLDALDDRIKNGGKIGVLAVFDSCLSGSEIAEVSSNEWALYRKQPRILYFNTAGGGGATLTVQDLTQGQSLESPTLTQHNVLTANALSQAQSLEAPSLTQHNLLAVDALGQAQTLGAPDLTQHNVLAVNTIDQTHALGAPALTQAHVLSAQDVAQAHALGLPALTQAYVLIVQAIGQGQSFGDPALTQHNVLVVNALGQAQVFGTPSLTAAGTLAVDAMAQAQSLGLPALVQHHVLAVDALTQAQAIGSPSLTQAHILTPDALIQSQTTDNVSFTIAASLAVQAIAQAQAFGSPDLTQHHVLTPDAIVQAQQLAEAALTQHGSLAVDGMTQAQALDALALTQHYAIIVQSLLQGHELGTSSLTANDVLTVAGITQAQLLEIPGLTQHAVLAVDGLTQAQILGLVGIGGAIIGIDGGTIVCFQRLGGRIVASRLGPTIVAATLH